MTIQSIMIDSREPQWMQMLRPAGIQPAVTALDAADVWVATADGQLLVIERKTVADLLASIADGRPNHCGPWPRYGRAQAGHRRDPGHGGCRLV